MSDDNHQTSKESTKKASRACYNREEFINELEQQAQCVTETEVPYWDRAAAFEQYHQSGRVEPQIPWWHWRNIPALSMALSVAAVVLVLTYVKPNAGIDSQVINAMVEEQVQQKLSESINTSVTVQVDALVDLKLREFAAEQQVILANYRADMLSEQQNSNLALASYVMKASRQERQEDMSDFIKFIDAQRKDEQLAQKIKFQQLERDISLQKVNLRQTDSSLPGSAFEDGQYPATQESEVQPKVQQENSLERS